MNDPIPTPYHRSAGQLKLIYAKCLQKLICPRCCNHKTILSCEFAETLKNCQLANEGLVEQDYRTYK
jgi:hypothetical protein